MKRSILLGTTLCLFIFSCKKNDLPSAVYAEPISSEAVVDAVWSVKNTGKFSDTSAVAKRGYGIVLNGNSIINRMIYSNWKITWLDKGYPILNRGVGGTTWAEKIPYIRDLATVYHPHDIVLYDGENEFLRATSNDPTVAPKLIDNFNRTMNDLRTQNPDARIYVVSMITCPVLAGKSFSDDINQVNIAYRNRVDQDAIRYPGKVKFIDIRSLYPTSDLTKFESDRIHIKATAYDPFYNALKTALPKPNTGAWPVGGDTGPIPPSPSPNVLPIASAGSDISVSLGWIFLTNTYPTLNGSNSRDPDGNIVTYRWTKVSGPSSYKLVTPTASKTRVENLVRGDYVFKLTVTDNRGGVASDNVRLTVRR